MIKQRDVKQEILERISSLEIAVIMLVNSLRRDKVIDVNDVRYRVLDVFSDKELDNIEKIITRPKKL